MRDIALWIVILIVAALGITFTATKVVPLLEDLRVVEPTDGVQCAIVSRVAEVSIDCWKKDKEEKPSWAVRKEIREGIQPYFDIEIRGPIPLKGVYREEPLHNFTEEEVS